ncbi:uncharacterized protein ARB_01693 [Trichophyton benhamiae CBS 112371]|uniref:Uncharacterized protein n=1 Tax=Arthroderma benhamiae (strain ATCC MYA-4681 / CBS 112371) TaxID=663331 RepID=D4AZS5_ARTBC|nr:uncharacterized protein ARB_01693 [Trichophyton benhamiae CBS 112371]EFE31545.1 hypothetical protein ARB_01693 [Trichophyton benhamiae CBS 112371]
MQRGSQEQERRADRWGQAMQATIRKSFNRGPSSAGDIKLAWSCLDGVGMEVKTEEKMMEIGEIMGKEREEERETGRESMRACVCVRKETSRSQNAGHHVQSTFWSHSKQTCLSLQYFCPPLCSMHA